MFVGRQLLRTDSITCTIIPTVERIILHSRLITRLRNYDLLDGGVILFVLNLL